VGQRRGAAAECVDLEDAHGPVPDDRLRVAQGLREQGDRGRPDVEPHPLRVDLLHGDDLGLGLGVPVLGDDAVDGQVDLHAQLFRRLQDLPGLVDELGLHDGLADLDALRLEEGEGHAAADDDLVDPVDQVGQGLELARHLRAPDDGDQGTRGLLEGLVEVGQLFLHQEACPAGLYEPGDPHVGGVAAVGVAEGVVDVHIGEACQFPGELLVVLLFPGIEPEVLQHDDVAGLHRVDGLLHLGAHDVLRQGHVLAEQAREALRHRSQAHLVDDLSLRPAEVGGDDHFRVFVEGVIDGGQDGPDARVVGDVLVGVEGNVEIEPKQHPLPLQIHLIDIFHAFTSTDIVGGIITPFFSRLTGRYFIAQVLFEIKGDLPSFILKKSARNDIRLRVYREMETSDFRPLQRQGDTETWD